MPWYGKLKTPQEIRHRTYGRAYLGTPCDEAAFHGRMGTATRRRANACTAQRKNVPRGNMSTAKTSQAVLLPMKMPPLAAIAALIAGVVSSGLGQDAVTASKQELDELVARIQQKLRADEKSPRSEERRV